jgi:hypothetical protein
MYVERMSDHKSTRHDVGTLLSKTSAMLAQQTLPSPFVHHLGRDGNYGAGGEEIAASSLQITESGALGGRGRPDARLVGRGIAVNAMVVAISPRKLGSHETPRWRDKDSNVRSLERIRLAFSHTIRKNPGACRLPTPDLKLGKGTVSASSPTII